RSGRGRRRQHRAWPPDRPVGHRSRTHRWGTVTAVAPVRSGSTRPPAAPVPGSDGVDRHRMISVLIVLTGGACGLAAQAGLVAVAGIGALLAGTLIFAQPRYAALVAVGMVLSNAPVVLARDHGVPGAVALV